MLPRAADTLEGFHLHHLGAQSASIAAAAGPAITAPSSTTRSRAYGPSTGTFGPAWTLIARPATVDGQDLPDAVTRRVTGQEQERPVELLFASGPSDRRVLGDVSKTGTVRLQQPGLIARKETGRDGVHPHTRAGPLTAQFTSEVDDAA